MTLYESGHLLDGFHHETGPLPGSGEQAATVRARVAPALGNLSHEPAGGEQAQLAFNLLELDRRPPKQRDDITQWKNQGRLQNLDGRPGRWRSYDSPWIPTELGWIQISAVRSKDGSIQSATTLAKAPDQRATGVTIRTVSDEDGTLVDWLATSPNGRATPALASGMHPEDVAATGRTVQAVTKAFDLSLRVPQDEYVSFVPIDQLPADDL